MNWAELIKELRYKMCITQEELAGMLGVAFVSINRYENHKTIPTMKVRRKLLHILRENNIEVSL
ncbi:MAG TPA: helix-turn-helix transcriptional regulator [Bacilli bacterium]|nr:helix-turn-helix transcriptional regulator [Bacilli bacterium]